MLEVWGRRNSSNVIAVMWTVGELGIEHKRHNVGGTFGGTDAPEYRKMNPNGVVPTIVDDGMVLWESNAIVRYLASTYGQGTLWPSDPKQRALSDQWMEWAKATFYPVFMPSFWQSIRVPADQRDQAAIDKSVAGTGKILKMLDHHLMKNEFVAGDNLTMGDIPLGANLYRYFSLPIERPAFPNLEAWYGRLCQRPAYQQHAMVPFGNSLEEWLELERAEA